MSICKLKIKKLVLNNLKSVKLKSIIEEDKYCKKVTVLKKLFKVRI